MKKKNKQGLDSPNKSLYLAQENMGFGVIPDFNSYFYPRLAVYPYARDLTFVSLSVLICKTQQWLQDWKRSIFILIPKKGNAKGCSNYHTIAHISHASKVMLKILWARLQQYMNHGLPDVQAGFRKGRGTRDQIANICWIIEKARGI